MNAIVTRVKYIYSILIIVVLSTNTAFAYSKNNHEIITLKAVEVIKGCIDEGLIEAFPIVEFNRTLVESNIHQDDLPKKAVLWHFRDNKKRKKEEAPLYGKVVMETGFDNWVDYLNRQIIDNSIPVDFYSALGAIIHYVQDMAVPAHAVPIFHPKKISKKDKFDEYKVTFNKVTLSEMCKSAGTGHSVNQIIDSLAKKTKSYIEKNSFKYRTSDNKEKEARWTAFWPEKLNVNGFGDYGCSNKFGKSSIKCKKLEKKKISIANSEYQRISRDMATLALKATIETILLKKDKLCASKNCAEKRNKACWYAKTKLIKKIQKDSGYMCDI